MARILLSATPASGHINPLVAIGRALQNQGHAVAMVTDVSYKSQIERADLELIPLIYPEGAIATMLAAFRRPVRWLSQLQVKPPQAYFLDHLAILTEQLIRIIREFNPDVLVTDLNFYAGAIAADACGLPYATYCAVVNTLLSPDVPPYGLGSDWYPVGHWRRQLWPFLNIALRAVLWRHDQYINGVRQQYGLKSVKAGLLAHSPYLSLVPTTEMYAYPRRHVPQQIMYVGPVTTAIRGETQDKFSYEWFSKDERPILYVSMGTIVEGRHVFHEVVRLARNAPWRAIMTLGRQADPSQFDNAPDNILVARFVPQLEVLKRVNAVISHGGNNTVTESLLHGRPLIVIPISADQPESAARIKAAGVGIRLRRSQAHGKRLGHAIDEILSDPSYRQRAQRVQASFQSCNGALTSALLIEKLAIAQEPILRPHEVGPTLQPTDLANW